MLVKSAPRPPLGAEVPSLSHVRRKWWLAGGINPGNCVVAYQAKRAASLSASLKNIANPGTFAASIGVAPDFYSEIGWVFDGTSQYLTTRASVLSGSSVFVRFSDCDTSATRCVFGHWSVSQGITRINAYRLYGGLPKCQIITDYFYFNPSGVLGYTGRGGYYNGGYLGPLTAYPMDIYLPPYGIGVQFQNGVPAAGTYFKGSIQALAIYSGTLTDMEVVGLSRAMLLI